MRADDGKLWVTPLAKLTQDEIACVRQLKSELLALLATPPAEDEALPESEMLDVIGTAPKFIPLANGYTRLEIKPQGVTEAEFRLREAGNGLWADGGEAETMEVLLARMRPQLREVRFDAYGPMLGLRMDDWLYFELFAFRRARWTQINAAAKRKAKIESEDDE
ncbi:MAG: hypothetical protein ACREXT_12725 [Gammaproteobacteria bacterium]